jgi:hypothetical protein
MAGLTAIQGVDDTLKKLAADAVDQLTPKPAITVGPLDRDDEELRLNWFLYRVSPHPAYRNMEPPQTGWRSARGRPPLALGLSYLLTAFPSGAPNAGDQEQFAHAGLAAVMRALHENAIVTDGDVALSPLALPLVEPLRITMETLDLEAITKLWTAASQPLRLSVGYDVSLVVVDAQTVHAAGPPVRTRQVGVAPGMGPRLAAVEPPRASHGEDLTVRGEGLAGAAFLLARAPGDPPGPAEGWSMTVVPGATGDSVRLQLPRADLEPGARQLGAATTANGLPAGRDSIALTVVPRVTGPAGPLPNAAPLVLETAHAAPDVEVFLRGARLDPTSVMQLSATEVRVTIPATTASGPAELGLRANTVAGPGTELVIA